MYAFLFISHLGMVVQAFLIHRYSDFPSRAILVAVVWYAFNDLVDYFVPIIEHRTTPCCQSNRWWTAPSSTSLQHTRLQLRALSC